MTRKIVLSILMILVMSSIATVYAHPTDGCYATGSAATINEGDTVTITVQCDNVPTINNVFGFQIGTTRSGDFDGATAPTAYTPGTFADAGTGATSGVIQGVNSLSGLYAVSRQGAETVTATNFTLGTYNLNAVESLTADGSIVITMTDADFILSNNIGASLSGWLRDVHDFTVTITNLDLAWLNGDATVTSDVTAISNLPVIEFMIGDKDYGQTNIASYFHLFNMDDTHQYSEAGSPAGDGTLEISVSADMTGHLACSNTINLGDTGSAIDVDTKLGTAGVITLKAGDADDDGDIDNSDATAIGANYSTNPGDDKDINGDGTVNILDLVHVGRNFNSTSGTCGTGV